MLETAWAASVAAQVLLFLLTWPGRKDWPWFHAWLAVSCVQAALMAAVRAYNLPIIYFWAWVVSETIVIAFLLAATAEVYRRRAERRVAVGRAGSWITAVAILIALSAFAATEPRVMWDWSLQQAIRIRGLFLMSLGASAALVLGIYRAFPCPTALVVVRHHVMFTAYLGLWAMAAWAHAYLSRNYWTIVDIISLAGTAILFLLWPRMIGPIPALPNPLRGYQADELDAQQVQLQATLKQARQSFQGGRRDA
jgi:hypothetical protein